MPVNPLNANQLAAIQQGRAMVRLIEAIDVLLPGVTEDEAPQLRAMQRKYKRHLRELLADLPAEVVAQILAASEHITGPVGDITLN